jgi:thiopurine S-methyltransferase
MNAEFWRARWQERKIGFHEGKPNELLARHFGHFDGAKRVFVPLCGKTEDLVYLAAQGHEVVGVELVEDAVKEFFAEHAITPSVEGNVYRAGSITIICGDYFATDVGEVDAIYDRGALIALPPEMQGRYVRHLPHVSRILLVTVEYPTEAMSGPPFSVPEAEVRSLYSDFRIDLVDERVDPRRRADGKLIERCYRITSRDRA